MGTLPTVLHCRSSCSDVVFSSKRTSPCRLSSWGSQSLVPRSDGVLTPKSPSQSWILERRERERDYTMLLTWFIHINSDGTLDRQLDLETYLLSFKFQDQVVYQENLHYFMSAEAIEKLHSYAMLYMYNYDVTIPHYINLLCESAMSGDWGSGVHGSRAFTS